jgi:hypothetical protein
MAIPEISGKIMAIFEVSLYKYDIINKGGVTMSI